MFHGDLRATERPWQHEEPMQAEDEEWTRKPEFEVPVPGPADVKHDSQTAEHDAWHWKPEFDVPAREPDEEMPKKKETTERWEILINPPRR